MLNPNYLVAQRSECQVLESSRSAWDITSARVREGSGTGPGGPGGSETLLVFSGMGSSYKKIETRLS